MYLEFVPLEVLAGTADYLTFDRVRSVAVVHMIELDELRRMTFRQTKRVWTRLTFIQRPRASMGAGPNTL